MKQLAFSASRGSRSFGCVPQGAVDLRSSVGGQLHRGDTPPLQLCQVLVRSPTIRYNVGARETPLLDNCHQCLLSCLAQPASYIGRCPVQWQHKPLHRSHGAVCGISDGRSMTCRFRQQWPAHCCRNRPAVLGLAEHLPHRCLL